MDPQSFFTRFQHTHTHSHITVETLGGSHVLHIFQDGGGLTARDRVYLSSNFFLLRLQTA